MHLEWRDWCFWFVIWLIETMKQVCCAMWSIYKISSNPIQMNFQCFSTQFEPSKSWKFLFHMLTNLERLWFVMVCQFLSPLTIVLVLQNRCIELEANLKRTEEKVNCEILRSWWNTSNCWIDLTGHFQVNIMSARKETGKDVKEGELETDTEVCVI